MFSAILAKIISWDRPREIINFPFTFTLLYFTFTSTLLHFTFALPLLYFYLTLLPPERMVWADHSFCPYYFCLSKKSVSYSMDKMMETHTVGIDDTESGNDIRITLRHR